MFEQEMELERQESSVVPLLLIVGLILAFVGVAAYYIIDSRKVLTPEQATTIAESVLKAQGPVTLNFHTGLIKGSVAETGHSVHYQLLAKSGLLTIGKDQGTYKTDNVIELTPKGQDFLKQIPGVSQTKEKDGTELYVVPVAGRKLVGVTNIKMLNPSQATAEVTWDWTTTQMGELLDAAGPTVKGFNTYDRSVLIQKYAANFYHGGATKIMLGFTKTDKGWQIAAE